MLSSEMDSSGSTVIEFQPFRELRNEYIVKELAAVDWIPDVLQ